jgi:hypothetical protein
MRKPAPAAARAAVPMLLAALVLTGCVAEKAPGLRIGKGQTNVVFGAPKPATPGANFNVTPPSQSQFIAAQQTDLLPDDSFSLPTVQKFRPPPLQPVVACPEAALNAFPAQAAGLDISGMPRAGRYRWKRAGTIQVQSGVNATIQGFESRDITDVAKTADNIFTFRTKQPDLSTGGITATQFRVKSASDSTPGQVDPVAVTETQVDFYDGSGTGTPRATSTFTPGIIRLPLPVVAGAAFSGKSVDSSSGDVLDYAGQVVRRERVDACGEVIDGWLVKATETLSKAGTSRQYNYIVATQLGGPIISEHIEQKGAAPQNIDFSLGQLNPDPIPAK